MNSYYFEPIEAYLLSIKEDMSYAFLFFLYDSKPGMNWRLTSYVKSVSEDSNSVIVETQNSLYKLADPKLTRLTITTTQFNLCRQGFTPYEAIFLTETSQKHKTH